MRDGMRGKRVRGECIDSLHQLLAGGEKGRLGGNARRLLEHHGNQLQLHACMYQIRDDYKKIHPCTEKRR
jgi:hypothetical protein